MSGAGWGKCLKVTARSLDFVQSVVGPLALLSHWVEEGVGSDQGQVARGITPGGSAEDKGQGKEGWLNRAQISPRPATAHDVMDSGGFGGDILTSGVPRLGAERDHRPPSAPHDRLGHSVSFLWVARRWEVLSRTKQSDVCSQFNVKKSTEPVQPRALLKFPDIYGPRPAVTAPEVINYADYTLRTTEESAVPASPQAPKDSRLKRQVTEELFILPQNGRGLLPLVPHQVALWGAGLAASL